MIVLFLLLIAIPVYAKPLQGNVIHNEPVLLCPRTPVLDKRGKLTSQINAVVLRGLIGVTVNQHTGQILYISPTSDMYGKAQVGDYMIKIEREQYRPCLLPSVSLYPVGFIMNITVQDKYGKVRVLPVRLK